MIVAVLLLSWVGTFLAISGFIGCITGDTGRFGRKISAVVLMIGAVLDFCAWSIFTRYV